MSVPIVYPRHYVYCSNQDNHFEPTLFYDSLHSTLAGRKNGNRTASRHSGKAPDCDPDELYARARKLVDNIQEDKGVFDYGVYKTKRRTEQVSAESMVHCVEWITILGEMKTNWKFKPFQRH